MVSAECRGARRTALHRSGLMEAVPTADIQYFALQNGINPTRRGKRIRQETFFAR